MSKWGAFLPPSMDGDEATVRAELTRQATEAGHSVAEDAWVEMVLLTAIDGTQAIRAAIEVQP